MGAYVPMVCQGCRRRQERWANSRFCSCGGRLALCERAASRKRPSFDAAVGQVVRNTRLKAGLTASALARKAGLSKAFLSDVENGKRGMGLKTWYDLAMALGGGYTSLLGVAVGLYRGNGRE